MKSQKNKCLSQRNLNWLSSLEGSLSCSYVMRNTCLPKRLLKTPKNGDIAISLGNLLIRTMYTELWLGKAMKAASRGNRASKQISYEKFSLPSKPLYWGGIAYRIMPCFSEKSQFTCQHVKLRTPMDQGSESTVCLCTCTLIFMTAVCPV